MANINSQQSLLALLAGETNSSSEPDRETWHYEEQYGRLPSLDQRVEMFLTAVNGPDATVSSDMRTAARERIIAAMAADLAEKIEGWSPEQTWSAQSATDNVNSEVHAPIAKTVSRSSTDLIGVFTQFLASILEGVNTRTLRMAAVPLVALFVAGTIWSATWRDYNDQLETSEGASSDRANLTDAPATAPRTRSLTPAGVSKPTEAEIEANLQHEIANAKAKYGLSSPALVPRLVDLASFYRSQGRYREAEELCDRALTIGQHISDPLNPDITRALRELAMIYRAEGRSKEAEALLKRANQR
jgi:Tetratricopeptide repeat